MDAKEGHTTQPPLFDRRSTTSSDWFLFLSPSIIVECKFPSQLQLAWTDRGKALIDRTRSTSRRSSSVVETQHSTNSISNFPPTPFLLDLEIMRISALALLAFLSTVRPSGAFVAPNYGRTTIQERLQLPILQSLTAPLPPGSRSNRSEAELDKEHEVTSSVPAAASGKVLEGGKVIDFQSLRGPSMAENALEEAKANVAQSNRRHDEPSTGILGINQEVISEVGHELGTFATSQDIQNCAAYLRSQAASGFFKQRTSTTVINGEIPATSKAVFDQILRQAYAESGEVTSAFAKTFYLGTQLLPEASREATWAVYVWCRRTDEIVDAPRNSNDEMLQDLGAWEMRLESLWDYGEVADVYDLCLLDVLVKYPTLKIDPFVDMIRGMLMDVPQLGQDRYDSFQDLHLYCYRVAGTVGLMCLPVFGCAQGFNEDIAREPALSLGVAFQLTNILRDVGEDAVKRGRVYLPQEDLKQYGVTEDQLFEQRVDENYINMMKFQIARARMYYERARRGVFMLAPESRLPVQSSLDAYGKILDKIEENGYDSLTKRAYVDKWEKLSIIPFSWYRTQDVSRYFPLPGDKPIPDLRVTD